MMCAVQVLRFNGGRPKMSKVVPTTLNPEWNEQFEFVSTRSQVGDGKLVVEVYDRDRFSRDDKLGAISFTPPMRSYNPIHTTNPQL